jgi:hypothetical protein
LSVIMLVSACGAQSPTTPDRAGVTGSTGATIKGSVIGTGQGAPSRLRTSATTQAQAGALTVSVVGTGVTSAVNNGQFTLEGVPRGRASLRFSGGGVTDAVVDLDDVQDNELIEVTVSLDDTGAAVESERRSGAGTTQLEGRVESLPPTTPAGSFVVAGQTVTTDASTVFVMHGSSAGFSDLKLGVRVHVKGVGSSSGLQASLVTIQNLNASVPVTLHGVISGFTGTSTDFEFSVDGRLVKGTSSTTFYGNSRFEDLADGARVEVKGLQADGYVAAERIHVSGKGDASGTNVTIEGTIGNLSGACPALGFKVKGQNVTTDGTTVFDPSCSELKSGTKVQVTGITQSDGSVKASDVKRQPKTPS